MKAKFIALMDFRFADVEILNVENEDELVSKIKDSEVIQIKNGDEIYGVNSNYIMWYML